MKIISYIKNNKRTTISCILIIVAVISIVIRSVIIFNDNRNTQKEYENLAQIVEDNTETKEDNMQEIVKDDTEIVEEPEIVYEILSEYKELYEINNDMIGWLEIADTVINYPVMQNKDEEFYLRKDFYGNKSAAGALILDTDSEAGIGTSEFGYKIKPSTNLIIHGHTMRNGTMFGKLSKYKDKKYFENHKIIKFSSLYEHREYEVVSVFYSQVYKQNDYIFKYYDFFNADTQAELEYWIDNISELNIHDNDIKASLGDEFLTLTCCAYHDENGRFVVVAKRIK